MKYNNFDLSNCPKLTNTALKFVCNQTVRSRVEPGTFYYCGAIFKIA